eukprot:c27105_g2_i4 orf=40-237(+)
MSPLLRKYWNGGGRLRQLALSSMYKYSLLLHAPLEDGAWSHLKAGWVALHYHFYVPPRGGDSLIS